MFTRINNYEVFFPYNLYDGQKSMIAKLFTCFEKGENILIESPTGTGKTLTVLSAVISYKKSDVNKYGYNSLEKVIFCTRTHAQIKHVHKELKLLENNFYDSCTMASREHLCVNPRVIKKNVNLFCRHAIKTSSCKHFFNYQKVSASSEKFEKFVKIDLPIQLNLNSEKNSLINFDIENLTSVIGDKYNICPYYFSREFCTSSVPAIVVAPYNYIIIEHIISFKTSLKKEQENDVKKTNFLKNSILIIDEGHNMNQIFEDLLSAEINLNCVLQMLKFIKDNNKENCRLDHFLKKLLSTISKNETDEIVDFYSLLTDWLDIKHVEKTKLFGMVYALKEQINEEFVENSAIHVMNHPFEPLDNVLSILLFLLDNDFNKADIQFYISKSTKTVNLWCLNSNIVLNSLHICRSIVVMSGTLSPMDLFTRQFDKIAFQHTFQGDHVIDRNNIKVCVIPNYESKCDFKFTYENRNDSKIIISLGEFIYKMILSSTTNKNNNKNNKFGVLVFFPSYYVLNNTINQWKQINIINKLKSLRKNIYIDDGKQQFDQINNHDYILFSVFRGKVSEGADFKDDACRMVFVVGIPFASVSDPKLKLKKKLLTENQQKSGLNWNDWYTMNAIHAVNQAVGRVIRHRHDFGAIFLIDSRFSENLTLINRYFSRWIKKFITTERDVSSLETKVSLFFSNNYSNNINVEKEKNNNNQLLLPLRKRSLNVKIAPKVTTPAQSFSINDETKQKLDNIVTTYKTTNNFKTFIFEASKILTNKEQLKAFITSNVQSKHLFLLNSLKIFLP